MQDWTIRGGEARIHFSHDDKHIYTYGRFVKKYFTRFRYVNAMIKMI